MINVLKNKTILLAMTLAALAGCNNDDKSTPEPEEPAIADKYFLAASSSGGGTAFTYTMAVDDLAKDTTITTQYPGTIENIGSYTQWGYNGTDALFAISYQQGNPAPGSIFQLSSKGVLKKMDDFVLDKGFNSIGSFSTYLAAIANGETLTGANDGKKGSVIYFLNLADNNKLTPVPVVTENFIGDQTASFVGVADAGNNTFLTAITLAAGPSGRPVDLDSIYVARLDVNGKLLKLYKDNRLSFAAGQFRSARYSQLANDASGNTYVFSTGYGATTKKCGALLIRKDADAFDAGYYFDIETASGGYKLRKVWSLSDDYFFLEMYNDAGVPGNSATATQYAIVRMSTKDFKWVRDGFPAVKQITSVGWPFAIGGKAYVSVVTPDTYPTVYIIDAATATAKKGISVSDATGIPGLGKLSPQQSIQ